MEKSLGLIHDHYPLSEQELRTYSPLSLAYIGDSVYDLVIRTMMVTRGNTRPGKFQKQVTALVSAKGQTQVMERILPHLTEEEETIFRRGKNAKPLSTAKNQTRHDYRIATAFETLLGYLYLAGRMERLLELTGIGLSEEETDAE